MTNCLEVPDLMVKVTGLPVAVIPGVATVCVSGVDTLAPFTRFPL